MGYLLYLKFLNFLILMYNHKNLIGAHIPDANYIEAHPTYAQKYKFDSYIMSVNFVIYAICFGFKMIIVVSTILDNTRFITFTVPFVPLLKLAGGYNILLLSPCTLYFFTKYELRQPNYIVLSKPILNMEYFVKN